MSSIHATAIIHPGAKIGDGCHIGPYCVIGEHVTLGAGCQLHSHVVIDGHTTLGQENEIFPFATIGLKTQDLKWKGGITRTLVGDRNILREYVSIHSATGDGEVTSVGSDNTILAYCHLAHNVTLGSRVIMSNVATLAGHVTVEDHAVIGGLAAVHQFCRSGTMAMIGDGNPAETRTINKVGMERNGVAEAAQTALKTAYKILFRERLTVPNALAKIEQELPPSPELKHLVQFVRASERGIGK